VRDPKKVRLVPLRKFRADGLTPVPGLQVNIDGKTAQVRAVGAGRVQVDYNHPFSGRTLIYNLTVEKDVATNEDKIRELIHRQIPTVDQQKFTVKLMADRLELEMPEEAFFLEGLQVVKRTLAADIEKFLPSIATVVFIENFKKPASAPAAETKDVEAAPATS
jgi:hypothetical protein